MKIRIRGNSLRLRITQPELTAMKASGEVSDAINFPANTRLVYRLLSATDASSPEATFANNEVVVRLPQTTFEQWANSDEVSIHGEQDIAGTDKLSLLVEKDFACLAPREGEDQNEMFANPDAGKVDC